MEIFRILIHFEFLCELFSEESGEREANREEHVEEQNKEDESEWREKMKCR